MCISRYVPCCSAPARTTGKILGPGVHSRKLSIAWQRMKAAGILPWRYGRHGGISSKYKGKHEYDESPAYHVKHNGIIMAATYGISTAQQYALCGVMNNKEKAISKEALEKASSMRGNISTVNIRRHAARSDGSTNHKMPACRGKARNVAVPGSHSHSAMATAASSTVKRRPSARFVINAWLTCRQAEI